MEEVLLDALKKQLTERKTKLNKSISFIENTEHLYDLLKEVDKALERIDTGAYGICEVCHDTIETERLLADPLVTVCLDHLSKEQQRALEADLEDAGKIQRALLPKSNLDLGNWGFTYHFSPAGIVSGDFCDVIPTPKGTVIFVLGDVSGKGISASLMMSRLHALLHSLISFNLPINEILRKANRLFCESTISANYATMIIGEAGLDGSLEISVAGHNPPFILTSGNVRAIKATGIPVGLFSDSVYEVEKFYLSKNDSIFLYTDGFTEATVNGTEYGAKRLQEQLLQLQNEFSAQKMLDTLLSEHKAFLGDALPGDDVTLAILKRI